MTIANHASVTVIVDALCSVEPHAGWSDGRVSLRLYDDNPFGPLSVCLTGTPADLMALGSRIAAEASLMQARAGVPA